MVEPGRPPRPLSAQEMGLARQLADAWPRYTLLDLRQDGAASGNAPLHATLEELADGMAIEQAKGRGEGRKPFAVDGQECEPRPLTEREEVELSALLNDDS